MDQAIPQTSADTDLAFVDRFLTEFLKGQPASGPFSYIDGLKPARVSMDTQDDGIELGDYYIRVHEHPTKTVGFGAMKRPAWQYEVSLTITIQSSRRDEPDTTDMQELGEADDLVGALLILLGHEVRTHTTAMMDCWADDALAAQEEESNAP